MEAEGLAPEAEGLEVVAESLKVEAACRWPGGVLKQAYETHQHVLRQLCTGNQVPCLHMSRNCRQPRVQCRQLGTEMCTSNQVL